MKTKLNPGALSLATNPMRPMFGTPRFFLDTPGDGGGAAGGGAGSTGTQSQGNTQTSTTTQTGGDFTAEQQAKIEALINQAFGKGASKAEREQATRIQQLEAELTKLKGGKPEGKDGKQGEGEKTYSQTDLQQLLAQKDEEYKPKLTAAEQRIAALLEKERSAAIIDAAAKAKAIDPQDVALLVGRHVAHDDQGNVVVLNDKGMPRLNASGDPMTVEEFVKQYVDSKPHLKQAANSGGAGSGTKTTPGSSQQQPQRPKSVREAALQFGQQMTSK